MAMAKGMDIRADLKESNGSSLWAQRGACDWVSAACLLLIIFILRGDDLQHMGAAILGSKRFKFGWF